MAAIAMVLTVFNGCTKEELKTSPDEVVAKTDKADVYLENGYLAFKNMNAVDSVINLLSKMSRNEKDLWEQKIGLTSARYEFDKLFDEYEKITSKEEFLKFKAKYAIQLKFNEMDDTDCSIDYPFISTFFVPVLNKKGIFKVGLSLFQFTKENEIIVLDGDMKKLENPSAYSNDKNVIVTLNLKSGGRNEMDQLIDNFGGWKTRGDRRLLNELRISHFISWNQPVIGGTTFVTKAYQIYLRQRCQKDAFIGGWKDYSTTYSVKNFLYKIGSGKTENLFDDISPEVNPKYDWPIYGYHIDLTYGGGVDFNYLERPLTSMQADVSCRGFDGIPYQISYVKHYSFP